MIYWVKAGDTGAVKVGYAARDVAGRVRLLQTGNAYPLIVLRIEQGGRDVEAELHRHYKPRHLQGEWFAISGDEVEVDLASLTIRKRKAAVRRSKLMPLPSWTAAHIRLVEGVEAAIQAAGTGAELARKVGVTRFAVQQWKATGIPLARVKRVSDETGISLEKLRPDLFLSESA